MSVAGSDTRCGFVAVLGLPNAGKSTLVNALAGQKVSIVSKKIQTTRNRVLGIVMRGQTQIILIDTPGIFAPRKTLEKAMVKTAWDALGEADIILHLVDASHRNCIQENQIITERLSRDGRSLLVLNKIDRVKKPALLELVQNLNTQFPYDATFMISALKNKGLDDVLKYLADQLPESPLLFDPDQVSDMPLRLMAAEITREKIFEQLHQELPYSIMVETEDWEDFKDGSIKISQVIYVQKDSQKSIVVGKGGSRIKQIGETSRRELEKLFERRVHLKLFAKVQENWAENL